MDQGRTLMTSLPRKFTLRYCWIQSTVNGSCWSRGFFHPNILIKIKHSMTMLAIDVHRIDSSLLYRKSLMTDLASIFGSIEVPCTDHVVLDLHGHVVGALPAGLNRDYWNLMSSLWNLVAQDNDAIRPNDIFIKC